MSVCVLKNVSSKNIIILNSCFGDTKVLQEGNIFILAEHY